MPAAIHAAFHPTLPAPEHDDLGGPNAGRAAHQHAAPTVVALEEVRAHLRREASGDLAHRSEQRQRTVGRLHGLVGDRRRSRGDQRLGDARVGGEVQVGEQGEVAAQEFELLGLGFLDLDHHVLRPGIRSSRHDVGAGGDVVGVGDRRAFAGTGLDEDLDAETFELAYAVRGHRHSVLGGLDLTRYADGADGRCGLSHGAHHARSTGAGAATTTVVAR